ncbi:hypothetical protein DRQ20_02290 [bacterium]|nr:MAG: hypothetical protein DRQ20_02290 [bacterium]
MFGKRKRTSVGIDVGSSLIKVVELEGIPKNPKIVRFGMTSLPSHAIVDGDIMDREAVIDAIKSLIESLGIEETEVVSAVPGRGVIVKKIQMDRMKESEAEEQIKWVAEQYISFPIDEVVIDFEILNPEVGEDQMEVLLVAAKKEMVEGRLSLLREAGLEPIILDVPAFAIQNVYEFNYEPDPQELIGMIHVGAQFTNITFIQGPVNHFTRDIPTSLTTLSQNLQRELGLPSEETFALIRGEGVENVDQASFKMAVNNFFEDIAVGIERVLPYLPEGVERVQRIVLSGGGALLPELPEFLKERFGAEVEILDPFKKIEYEEGIFETEPAKIAPIAALSIGLAIRGE